MKGIGENEETGGNVMQKMDEFREKIHHVEYHH